MCATDHVQKVFREEEGGARWREVRGDKAQASPPPSAQKGTLSPRSAPEPPPSSRMATRSEMVQPGV